MTHSHLPVEHLLKQVEAYKSTRQRRGIRPDWVTRIVHQMADLFEPTSEVGRVGYVCELIDDCWTVRMYLGSTEVVGGAEDGQSKNTDFQFDLHRLIERFAEIERFRLGTYSAHNAGSTSRSIVAIDGQVGENRIRLEVHTVPPADAEPGFRLYPDGRRQTV